MAIAYPLHFGKTVTNLPVLQVLAVTDSAVLKVLFIAGFKPMTGP